MISSREIKASEIKNEKTVSSTIFDTEHSKIWEIWSFVKYDIGDFWFLSCQHFKNVYEIRYGLHMVSQIVYYFSHIHSSCLLSTQPIRMLHILHAKGINASTEVLEFRLVKQRSPCVLTSHMRKTANMPKNICHISFCFVLTQSDTHRLFFQMFLITSSLKCAPKIFWYVIYK